MDRSLTHGSLESGKFADFILLRSGNWEHLIYELIDPPIQAVFKHGNLVFGHV
jgi:imidazolonepropionase